MTDDLSKTLIDIARAGMSPPCDSRDPDHTKTGIFVYNRCSFCRDGELPCRKGAYHRCDNPVARND
jgi:hypothetical protein